MAICLIGLGSNQGDRQSHLDQALDRIGAGGCVRVLAVSGAYETESVGGPVGQDPFLNGAACLETSRSAADVLDLLLSVEIDLGRRRTVHWGPRAIDLDLLLYDDMVLETPRLTIPHPRMSFRRFVLQPAAEIASDWVHPTLGWDIATLWHHIDRTSNYVAIAGPVGAGKKELARDVTNRMSEAYGIDVCLLKEVQPVDSQKGAITGHTWQAELESLDQRSELLDTEKWKKAKWKDTSTWVLSDFWFDQCLADAEVWFDPPQAEQFREILTRKRAHVVPPKLRIVLRASSDFLMQSMTQRNRRDERSLSRAQVDRMRVAVERITQVPGQGPMLILDAANRQRNVDEVTAALLAMQ